MTRHISGEIYNECLEYHGNTTIELIRTLGGETVRRDWLMFDTVEEAADYFNAACCVEASAAGPA